MITEETQSSDTALIAVVFKIDWEIQAMSQHRVRGNVQSTERSKSPHVLLNEGEKKENQITAILILNNLNENTSDENELGICVRNRSEAEGVFRVTCSIICAVFIFYKIFPWKQFAKECATFVNSYLFSQPLSLPAFIF